MNIKDILAKFGLYSSVSVYGNGHINNTYVTEDKKYILQEINISVFKDPDALMSNIESVTNYLRKQILLEGGDPERETLTIVKTLDGKNYYYHDDNNVYRVYKYVHGTKSIETGITKKNIYEAGVGFGHFQVLLKNYPAESLAEVIKDFHNTPSRVEAFKSAVAENSAGRASLVKSEIDFVLENSCFAARVTDGIKDGSIPLRVTHNDTKINNILFDEVTEKAVCVIDLDTVMPGSVLYDFGDALRIGASTAAEDETDLDKVSFDLEIFRSYVDGFLSEMKPLLTKREIELLPFSVKLLTYECGTRFLTDYLNGDKYFKIHRENHNLDRARNQFKLVKDIESKELEMIEIVKEAVLK